jgi:CheY-like chemotaxis protein/HPt (histidine-containing phosphotransfer) domain-containing protein
VKNRRVLLVEDDASISRFVAMAVEDLEVDLVPCADVACALAELQAKPARLLITDLMLPGLSGFDLLQRLQADPALQGDAKVAIFSAGINAAVLAQLEALPVWRVLRKPASVVQLQACVQDALADAEPPAPPQAPAMPDDGDVVTTYFAGNTALFHAYRAKCRVQLPHDLQAGDAALDLGDLAALQRLSHSLATVLRTLGWSADSVLARQIEAAAGAGDQGAARQAWERLRPRLLQV